MKYFLKDALDCFSEYEVKNTLLDKFFYTVAWATIRVLILAALLLVLTTFYGFFRYVYLCTFHGDEIERKSRVCDIYSQGIVYKNVQHYNQDYEKYTFSYEGRSVVTHSPSLSCKYIIVKEGKYKF